MIEPLPPQSRAERLIAAGRVVLAATSLFAVWLEPSEPARHAGVAYSLLAAYLVYSIAVAAFSWRPEPPSERRRLLTHAFDLVFFSLFVYFTTGPASPFTTYFVFSLVCATVRWQWRGTLWTAVAAMVAFVGVGLYRGEVLQDPTFPLHSFIIRAVYLAVVATLLGYLGFHEHTAREEMSLLAGWRQRLPAGVRTLVGEDLAYACRVLGCPRAILVWTEREEPWVNVASWDGAQLAFERRAPADDDPWVARELVADSFFSLDLDEDPEVASLVWRKVSSGLERWRGRPFPAGLPLRGCRSVLTCPLDAEITTGRVFFLDRREITMDELTLGEVAAGILAARLEHFHFTEALALSAADQERVRLARDLHDGVLQSLTGIALQLAAARRRLDENPGAAVRSLEDVRELIALEQRDLRFFIEELRPRPGVVAPSARELPARLEELEERIEREWNLAVELELEELGQVPETVGRHVYLLVREALVNAVRHGQATRVRVALLRNDGDLRITVADNGRGFPNHGSYSLRVLEELNTGPRNIRERLGSLHGSLDLESSSSGARLVMTVPVDPLPGAA